MADSSTWGGNCSVPLWACFQSIHLHRDSRGTDPDCFEKRTLGVFPLNHKLMHCGCKRESSEVLFPYRDGRFQDSPMPRAAHQPIAEPISVKPLS